MVSHHGYDAAMDSTNIIKIWFEKHNLIHPSFAGCRTRVMLLEKILKIKFSYIFVKISIT